MYIGSTPTSQNFTSGTDYFNGDGSTTAFTLSRRINSVNDIEVVINNVTQQPNTAYTVLNNTITFTSAPSTGSSNIYVRYLSTATQTITPSPGTVYAASIAAGQTFALNGVQFPATQVPSADANTLDDYEEGTWTPIDSSGAGLSFTVNTTSTYTKVGNIVIALCSITYPSTANSAQMTIGGLPFTAASSGFGGGFNKYSTYSGTIYAAGAPTNTVLYGYTNGGGAISNANMSGSRVDFVITYRSIN